MKKNKGCIVFIIVLLCIFSAAGCSFFRIEPYVPQNGESAVSDNPTSSSALLQDYSYAENVYIDKDLVLDTVEKSAQSVYPDDVSGFCYIFNRMILSEYADTDLKKEFILGMYLTMLSSQETCVLPKGLDIDPDELDFVFTLLDGEAPEIMHVVDEYRYVPTGSRVASISFEYNRTPGEYLEMLTKVFEFFDNATEGKNLQSDADVEKCIHDSICDACVFGGSSENRSNAYGACVEGYAICEGYADAFSLGMTYMGLPCCRIWGEGVNIEGLREMHAWNMTVIGGERYHVDVTWDDPKDGNIMLYSYFNLPDAEIFINHIMDEKLTEVFPTNCTSTEYNYHVRNGLVVDADTDCETVLHERLDELLGSGKTKGGFMMKMISRDEFDRLTDDTERLFKNWMKDKVTLKSVEYDYIYDSSMQVIYFDVTLIKR